jgi:hypothetical protein
VIKEALTESEIEKAFKEIKNSLEDFESQGGRITKKVIKDSVADWALSKEEQKELIGRLEAIFK